MPTLWGFELVFLVKKNQHAAMPNVQPRNRAGRPSFSKNVSRKKLEVDQPGVSLSLNHIFSILVQFEGSKTRYVYLKISGSE